MTSAPAEHLPPLTAPLVGVLMATSSLVFVEPAPYDFLLIALLMLAFAAGLRVPREIQVPAAIVFVFALCNILAAALAPEPAETLRSLFIRLYLALSWLFFVCVIVSAPRRVLPLLWGGYLVAAVFATLFGAAEYFGFIASEAWEGGLRAKGPFKDPNVFGPFLVPVALHCASGLRRGRTFARLARFALFLFFAFGILISFSRGAWMNFLLSTLVFLSLTMRTARSLRQRLNWLLGGAVLVLAAAIVLTLAILNTSVADRFFQRAVLTQKYDVAQEGGRFPTQLKALNMIGATPLGIGPGRAHLLMGLPPHNVYLFMLLEAGWLGGLAWLTFVLSALWLVLRLLKWRSDLRDHAIVVGCSLVGTLVQSFFIDSHHWRHLWLLLALAWALVITARREAEIAKQPVAETNRLYPAGAHRA